MKLFFLRHGIAVEADEWSDGDETRPLTDAGKERMQQEAAAFARLGLQVDVILTSPLIRAAETAAIAARELGKRDALVRDERLSPGFGVKELAKILADHAHANAVMLVGHEPDFSSTIAQLIGGGRVVVKKGGLALVEIQDVASMCGELAWLLPPKVLEICS